MVPGPKPQQRPEDRIERVIGSKNGNEYGATRHGNPIQRMFPEPQPGNMMPDDIIAHDDLSLTYWNHYMATMAEGHLKPADAPILSALCLAHATLARAADDWAAHLSSGGGIMSETSKGSDCVHPLLPFMQRQSKIITDLATRLAIMPAERNRIVPRGAKPEAPQPTQAGSKFFS